MSDNNAPDEAERLLDELIRNSCQSVDSRILDVDAGLALHRASLIAMDELRSQLLPLIRSGLAMQRLENAMRETGMECANVGTNKDGAWCFLQCRDFSEPEGDGDTIPEAINAALDAAGVEK